MFRAAYLPLPIFHCWAVPSHSRVSSLFLEQRWGCWSANALGGVNGEAAIRFVCFCFCRSSSRPMFMPSDGQIFCG